MTNALITGGSRGLGLALATDLVASGWHVVLDGRDDTTLQEASTTLGPRAHAVAGDVADPGHRADLVEAARRLGGLDLLVNNASTLGPTSSPSPTPLPRLRHQPPGGIEALYEVNVFAPLRLIQAALPLLERSGGAIVNVTSDAAVEAYEGWGGYGSSKAALEQLSHVLAVEEADVSVWWFDPGDMRTRLHQDAFPGEDISDRPHPVEVVPALRRLLEERPPSGRVTAATLLGATS